ncbi:MAG TPA: hypothetical protein ACFYD4_07570 [Candidatus Wunengus sp. YC61]|uniref:hypothetical protein n=1 Tax=Candidatus Wunengus sp. YC61 TaxID=3367698 RepID=UPI0040287238
MRSSRWHNVIIVKSRLLAYNNEFTPNGVQLLVSQEIVMNKQEWLDGYKKRMLERGISETMARACTSVEAYNPDILDKDPEDAADEELSYWGSDG